MRATPGAAAKSVNFRYDVYQHVHVEALRCPRAERNAVDEHFLDRELTTIAIQLEGKGR